MRRLALLAAVLLASACGGGDEPRLTIYLKQRLGSEGPPGQVVPVLMPLDRDRRDGFAPERQALDELWRGPSAQERARGFLDTLPPGTKHLSLSVDGTVATVDLTGEEPDFYASAAIVYSLTSIPGIRVVRLLLEGEPCCAYDHRNRPIARLTRRHFAGWPGEPCPERARADAVRCRG